MNVNVNITNYTDVLEVKNEQYRREDSQIRRVEQEYRGIEGPVRAARPEERHIYGNQEYPDCKPSPGSQIRRRKASGGLRRVYTVFKRFHNTGKELYAYMLAGTGCQRFRRIRTEEMELTI